jgi:hypothetical protein
VLLPLQAQDVVERLAEEEEISHSRVVSNLVVEALKARGEMLTPHQKHAQKKAEELGLDVQTIATRNPENNHLQKQRLNILHEIPPEPEPEPEETPAAIDDDDLRLLKKLKLLKELGLL